AAVDLTAEHQSIGGPLQRDHVHAGADRAGTVVLPDAGLHVHALAAVAGRAGVGDVVADRVERALEREQGGTTGGKQAAHVQPLGAVGATDAWARVAGAGSVNPASARSSVGPLAMAVILAAYEGS